MSSGGHSVEGDCPPDVDNCEEVFKESPWTNLPIPVFSKLCEKLDKGFIHTARQVCPNWLNDIENLIGLTVKIDDTFSGNLEFVQTVKVVQARIVNWTAEIPEEPDCTLDCDCDYHGRRTLLFQFPHCLKKLTICGKMPNQWKLQHLWELPNLAHLVFRGVSLHSNNLTGLPFPEPDKNLSSEDRQLVYFRFQPHTLPNPVYLRSLKTFEVIMNEFSYPSILPLSLRLIHPDRAMEQEILLERLYFIVLNNVTFILNNLRCPILNTIQFYIYPKAGTEVPTKLNWKYQPFQRFLEAHKNTLKEIYLPDFEGKHDSTEPEAVLNIPTRLNKLQVNLSRFVGDREQGREQDSLYWQRLLMEQTQLAEVLLTFTDFSTPWIDETLTNLLFSSKETLDFVDISIQSEETINVNLEMFAFCHNLRVLKISGRDHETILRNINKLPASLTKLYISMALVEPPSRDTDFLKKYTNLEMVVVKTIVVPDQPQTHGRTLAMLRNILSLRKLNLLMLTFDAPLNSNQDVMHMLRVVDDEMDSPYPVFTVKFNLSYEFQEGWGEEIFDEETLNMEYINMREPEDYNAFHSRHRNAISVDHDAHRHFMYQTLPFLLDLRDGRVPGGGITDIVGNRVNIAEDDDDGNADDEDTTRDTDSDDDTDVDAIFVDDSATEL